MLTSIRDIGSQGVLTDIDQFTSTPPQFSFAKNARFEKGTISRGPVFATVNPITNTAPRFLASYKTLTDVATFNIGNRDGTIVNWVPGALGGSATETDISIGGYVPSTYDEPYTATIASDVIYVNRPDRVPWFKTLGGATYTPITTGSDWGATWRCKAFRSVGGVLVAINMTIAGVSYPTMVKTSDFMTFGTIPAQWVSTVTNSATENVIADLQEPLIDGVVHRDRLVLYSENEAWLMEPTYDFNMFRYRRLFTNAGVISQNCVAEFNNTHFVFGSTDIWAHDTFSRQSLAFGAVKDFIFNSILRDYSYLFFVVHQPRNNEVMFCYVSDDAYCTFPAGASPVGCNRAAVYNYLAKTWTFYDLPYLTGAGLGLPVSGTTYTGTDPITYDSIVGTYSSFSDTSRVTMMTTGVAVTGVNGGNLACAMRTFELPDVSGVNGVLDEVATADVLLENDVISTDDWGTSLRDYKLIKAIYPRGVTTATADPLYFDWGAADYPSAPPATYSGDPQSFDGEDLYKLDYRMAGRYLSFRMTYSDWRPFTLSGFDIDWERQGQR